MTTRHLCMEQKRVLHRKFWISLEHVLISQGLLVEAAREILL